MKFEEMPTLNNAFMSSAEIKRYLWTKEDTWNKIQHWKLNRLLVLQHTRTTIMKYLYEIFMQQTDISSTCIPVHLATDSFKNFKNIKNICY